MTVGWTFAGGSCSGAAVEQVRIAIAGEPLQQDTFDCRSGLVTFTDFYPGTYNVTVQGLDSTQAVPSTGSQRCTLDPRRAASPSISSRSPSRTRCTTSQLDARSRDR